MAFYTFSRSSFALTTGFDSFNYVPAANRRANLIEMQFGGMGTASSANEIGLYRQSTAGSGTAPSVATATKRTIDGPAAAGTCNISSWGTSQTGLGGEYVAMPVNSNGGFARWVAYPGEEFEVNGRSSDGLCVRSASGTGTMSGHIGIMEDPA